MKKSTQKAMRLNDHLKILCEKHDCERILPFDRDIQTFQKLYSSLDVRVLTYFVNNQHVNIASQFVLSTKSLPEQTRVKRTNFTDKLQLIRTIENPDCISKYISSLFDGTLYIDKRQVYLMKGGSMLHHSPTAKSLESDSANRDFGLPYYTSILEWNGESVRSVIDEFGRLERQLASLDKPMENLYDLIESHMYFRRNSSQDASNLIGFVQFLAPAYVGFSGEIQTSGHQVSVRIKVVDKKKIDISQLSVGIITDDGLRKTIKGSQLNVKSVRDGYLFRIKGIGTANTCTLFLKMFGLEVGIMRLKPSSLALSGYVRELFGNWRAELKKLKSAITKESELLKDDTYEKYVARLLTMMGFICNPLGLIAPNSNVPDGIAVYPNSKNIVIYECTVGTPGTSKLDKLAIRANKVKTRCPSFNFHSVMFLNAKLSELSETQKRIAMQSEITIVDHTGTLELIEKITTVIDEKEILDWFLIQRIRGLPFNALS